MKKKFWNLFFFGQITHNTTHSLFNTNFFNFATFFLKPNQPQKVFLNCHTQIYTRHEGSFSHRSSYFLHKVLGQRNSNHSQMPFTFIRPPKLSSSQRFFFCFVIRLRFTTESLYTGPHEHSQHTHTNIKGRKL